MTGPGSFLRRFSTRLVALAIIAALYSLTWPPAYAQSQRDELAAQFDFSYTPLPEVPGLPLKSIRNVNPSLKQISAWISSVGASIALNDLDGDSLANDACYVDTRVDRVIVAPVPGTGERYPLFTLDAAPLRFDPATMAPMGCLPGDLNEDGLMDVVAYYWGRTPVAFIQQSRVAEQPLSSATYARQEIVPGEERWFTNAATFADLDGDGHLDLIVGNYFPDGAHILDANSKHPEQMQHSMSRAYNAGWKHFLLWSGATSGAHPSVSFTDTPLRIDDRMLTGWTLAIGASDLDGDMLPELYFANDFGPDRLLHNRSTPGRLDFVPLLGERTITTPGSKILGHDSFKGMGVDFGDLNRDGLTDIFVSNIATEYALEESNMLFVNTGQFDKIRSGTAPFVDESEPLGLSRGGWGWDVRLDDFNNDGVLEALQATGFIRGSVNRWPELQELAMSSDELLANPKSWPRFEEGADIAGHQHNPFFVRAGDGRYYDLAAEIGVDEPHVTRGLATADVDGDGSLDLAIANQWSASGVYRNQSPNTNAFLGLRLRLPVGTSTTASIQAQSGLVALGHPAVGATATVHLPDGRTLVAQVDGGNGHSGKRSSDLHFGLGDVPSTTPLQVNLQWRDTSGTIHRETTYLTAGWHTIQLGS
ncbi:MAG TPA: CRTAC1 family protein [Herpetosiphonaceae bacterium]